jgi:putative DNA primase/helicase
MNETELSTFSESMAANGLPCHDIVPDGKIHRFKVNGDKPGSKNGWYILFNDGFPVGAFGSWKLNQFFSWCGKSEKAMSDAERTKWRERIAKAKKARDEEQKRLHAEARKKAARIFENSIFITEHAYLESKGLKVSFTLREDSRKRLVIPIIDTDGVIHSLQFINSNGGKKFLPGGAITGHFSSIDGDGDVLLIAEGYATGASLHEATGYPVACALNCGNLKPVCEALHKKSPDTKLVVCTDDDFETSGNPSLTKAKKAAQAVSAGLAIPKFKDQEKRGTDFNDLHKIEGLEAVRLQIIEALRALTGQTETLNIKPQFRTIEVRNFLAMKFPPRDKMIDPILLSQSLTMVHSFRGCGKTSFALGIASAIVTGENFLKWQCPKPQSVLYVDGELPACDLQDETEHNN